MPRAKTGLSASEYAVLGLLLERPTYGYELQRELAATSELGSVCPVEPAMVYAILKSLAGLELIDGRWDNSQYPPKAVYAATPAGENEFGRWLRHPVARIREVRSDFLIKLYFALRSDRDLARELIEAQDGVCKDYLLRVQDELRSAKDGVFPTFVLGSKLSAVIGAREWLAQCLRELR